MSHDSLKKLLENAVDGILCVNGNFLFLFQIVWQLYFCAPAWYFVKRKLNIGVGIWEWVWGGLADR